VIERDIDLLCVSRLHLMKNLPMIASALLVYRQKYSSEPIRMTLIAGKPAAYEQRQMSEMEREEYTRISAILGRPEDFIDFVDAAEHHREMPTYYARARAVVLGSLLEGKSRCINEAQSCNTPVICFEALNQFARGDAPSFPPEAGLTSAYDAEALADVIHTVLHHEGSFRPRASYLRTNGRRNFLGRCLDSIEYFQQTIPALSEGDACRNIWLDLAVHDNYGVSLHDFLYGRLPWISHASGLDHVEHLATFYSEKFAM
jgi:glycosyltransferase involved in cell wall biosynthesis